jgi:hypothetical protein
MKDWTGNKKSLFTTLGASNHSEHQRQGADYYATNPDTIDPLFKKECFSDVIWEPACGEGHLSKKMEDWGKTVISQDLIDRNYGEGNVNFLKQTKMPCPADIITNPPYRYAKEFVEKGLELISKEKVGNLKVAMFLKLTFLEGKKRRELFNKYPPKIIYVFSERQKCAINGDFENTGSSAACYAWFVWEKDIKEYPTLKWI